MYAFIQITIKKWCGYRIANQQPVPYWKQLKLESQDLVVHFSGIAVLAM